jgi:hypothetical protein
MTVKNTMLLISSSLVLPFSRLRLLEAFLGRDKCRNDHMSTNWVAQPYINLFIVNILTQ